MPTNFKEFYKVKSAPLCQNGNESIVTYTKYEKLPERMPVNEAFFIQDPTYYDKDGTPTYEGGYAVDIQFLRGTNSEMYPQVCIIDDRQSFAVWNGQKFLGTSALPKFTVDELNDQQLEKYQSAVSILSDVLPQMAQLNPNNTIFKQCMDHFGINHNQTFATASEQTEATGFSQ